MRSSLAKEKGCFIVGHRCFTIAAVTVGALIRSSSFVKAARITENYSDCT
jgi:hypothetical protein